MRIILKKISLFAFSVVTMIAGVNYFGDAANIFSNDYVKRISEALLQGHNITNIYNYDERILQKEIIQTQKDIPDVVVIGSSRTLLIKSSYFPNRSFFNHSVSGASLQDLIAIYQLYRQKGHVPKEIILAVDPWILNENNGQDRWVSLASEYYSFCKNSGFYVKTEKVNQWKKYLELLSPSYFQSSLKTLYFELNKPEVTEFDYGTTSTKLNDGSATYDLITRNASIKEVTQKAELFLQGEVYSLENFSHISSDLVYRFERFLEVLRSDNIKVVFFLAPYHPTVFKRFQEKAKYKVVMDSETYFRKVADNLNIKVIGSYNPSVTNFKDDYFYDGMHLNEKAVDIIMKSKDSQ